MIIERQIEFDKVKELWEALAMTDGAKAKIREASICFSENELRKQLRDTTEARDLIEKMGTPPFQNISEIMEILKIAEKGDCLTPYQLERVEKPWRLKRLCLIVLWHSVACMLLVNRRIYV